MTLHQIRFAARSMKSRIADAIILKLQDVWELKYFSFDRIRVLISDFQDTELPGCQVIDLSETIQHEQSRVLRRWQLAIEVVDKQSQDRYVNQKDLWDLTYQIERKLWAEPNFGINGVLHAVHLGTTTDLHMTEPYYTARILLEIVYYDNLVRDC